ncbi:MAG: hypothetical protein EHM70_04700, partial [Chloroflexota bacterium]
MPDKLNRRDFLRLCVITATGVVVYACEQSLPLEATHTPSATPGVTPSPTPGLSGKIELEGWQADAWTWVKDVRGKLSGNEPCEDVIITVNGNYFPATLDSDRFSASIQLSEGDNRIYAVCRRPDGQEDKSMMLHYYERLRKSPKAIIQIKMDGQFITLHGRDSQPAEAGPRIIDRIWSTRPGNPAPLWVKGGLGLGDRELDGELSAESITLLPPQVDGEYYVRLSVRD